MLSVEVRLSVGSWGKYFKDPHTGDCDVARSIRVEIQAAPWVFNVPSPSFLLWKKSNSVFSKAKTKAKVHSFCFILKLSPSEPLLSAAASVFARPTRSRVPGWDRAQMYGASAFPGGQERKRDLLWFPGILLVWVWDGPSAFSKEPINFPSFCGLFMGHLPMNPFFSQTRLTSFFGQAPPPASSCYNPFQRGEGRSVNPLGGAIL